MNNKANISNIAFRPDFNDSNYFSKQFKKKFGISPKQRALNKKPKNFS